MCCGVLQYVAVCYNVLQRRSVHLLCLCIAAVCCNVLQGVAVCRSVLQCVAVYCNVSQCVAAQERAPTALVHDKASVLQWVAVCRSVFTQSDLCMIEFG